MEFIIHQKWFANMVALWNLWTSCVITLSFFTYLVISAPSTSAGPILRINWERSSFPLMSDDSVPVTWTVILSGNPPTVGKILTISTRDTDLNKQRYSKIYNKWLLTFLCFSHLFDHLSWSILIAANLYLITPYRKENRLL